MSLLSTYCENQEVIKTAQISTLESIFSQLSSQLVFGGEHFFGIQLVRYSSLNRMLIVCSSNQGPRYPLPLYLKLSTHRTIKMPHCLKKIDRVTSMVSFNLFDCYMNGKYSGPVEFYSPILH